MLVRESIIAFHILGQQDYCMLLCHMDLTVQLSHIHSRMYMCRPYW